MGNPYTISKVLCHLRNFKKRSIVYVTRLENTIYLHHIHLAIFWPLDLRFFFFYCYYSSVVLLLGIELAIFGAECNLSAAFLYHITI